MREQEITEQTLNGIIDYMKTNKKTFIKVHEEMDKDRNNYVSRKELKEFL